MRVLITWGSKRGGTEGIARIAAERLRARGFEVVERPAADVDGLEGFEAVIVGGAIYANRWAHEAARFVRRNVADLRRVPVWLFSSGPLDDSADQRTIPPIEEVSVLAERIGAIAHHTFGGRLEPETAGVAAAAMAREHGGDFRNPERIMAWADAVADEMPRVAPRTPMNHPARSIPRLLAHGVVGWALCGATMALMLAVASVGTAMTVHAIAAPVLFGVVAWHYFREHGARLPLHTALVWTGVVAFLDFTVVALAIQHSLEMFESVVGTWLPFALIFFATWCVGWVMLMTPWSFPRAESHEHQRA